LDLAKRAVVARVEVGENPVAMALHPSGDSLWVSCEGNHTVVVLEVSELPDSDSTQPILTLGDYRKTMENRIRHERMKASSEKEVRELHQFFEAWFSGRLTHNKETLDSFSEVLHPDFHIISPSGDRASKVDVVEQVDQAYSSFRDGSIRIWIEDLHFTLVTENTILVTYEEWQDINGRLKGRVSSAVLQENLDLPNGLEWLHVHETWIPRDEADQQE
jgi:hypothetical protein